MFFLHLILFNLRLCERFNRYYILFVSPIQIENSVNRFFSYHTDHQLNEENTERDRKKCKWSNEIIVLGRPLLFLLFLARSFSARVSVKSVWGYIFLLFFLRRGFPIDFPALIQNYEVIIINNFFDSPIFIIFDSFVVVFFFRSTSTSKMISSFNIDC